MGVSGCGKSVVGSQIADHLTCQFIDGDDLHPPENVAWMKSGKPLDDERRKPWLSRIVTTANDSVKQDESIVIACSALKKKYREQLRSGDYPIVFVWLKGDRSLILERLQKRTGHYMPPSLLDSQFADLEEPGSEPDVLTIEIHRTVKEIVDEAIERLKRLVG